MSPNKRGGQTRDRRTQLRGRASRALWPRAGRRRWERSGRMYAPLYCVRGVPNIFGTEHVIKSILHIYILSSGVYYNILHTSESYYKIELVYLLSAMFYSTGCRSLLFL